MYCAQGVYEDLRRLIRITTLAKPKKGDQIVNVNEVFTLEITVANTAPINDLQDQLAGNPKVRFLVKKIIVRPTSAASISAGVTPVPVIGYSIDKVLEPGASLTHTVKMVARRDLGAIEDIAMVDVIYELDYEAFFGFRMRTTATAQIEPT